MKTLRPGGRPLIIAELGTSHSGDPVKALELIAAAAEAGADCVKCQIVYADEILHPETGMVTLPGGPVPLYETFKRLEQKPEFYAAMKEAAEKQGLLFLATPFGPKSAEELKQMSPKAVKIASPELNYRQLVDEIASWKIPVYLSTGVSLLGDIEEALAPFKDADGYANVCLLHCVTAYPAPPEEYNLRIIPLLAGVFGVDAGVSDHSLDPVLIPALAAILGAAAIEKHFCLSRSDPGLDDPIALPPKDFARMVKAVREAAARRSEGEKEAAAAIREEYGELTGKALGDGVKRLAASEQANYERTRRSLHALRTIEQGEIITRENIAVLRTEKVLRPGLPPSWLERVCGKTAKKTVPNGQGIRLEDIL